MWSTLLLRAGATALAFFSFMSVSQAGLIGDTVDLSWRLPTFSDIFATHNGVLVGPGVEIACPGSSPLCGGLPLIDGESIDIGDFTIRVDTLGGFAAIPFHGLLLESLDLGGAITGFVLNTDIPGFDSSRIAFGADFLSINFAGVAEPGGAVEVTLLAGSTDVPEPASLALLGGGLAGLGLLRRRRRA